MDHLLEPILETSFVGSFQMVDMLQDFGKNLLLEIFGILGPQIVLAEPSLDVRVIFGKKDIPMVIVPGLVFPCQ